MTEDNEQKIINIFPAIIERNRQKICQCKNPTYVIDETNHIVSCKECGAILDPWAVLFEIAQRWEQIAKDTAREKERLKFWREEERKIIRFRGVQDITRKYRQGMWPVCPECKQVFDPGEVSGFVNAALYGMNNGEGT